MGNFWLSGCGWRCSRYSRPQREKSFFYRQNIYWDITQKRLTVPTPADGWIHMCLCTTFLLLRLFCTVFFHPNFFLHHWPETGLPCIPLKRTHHPLDRLFSHAGIKCLKLCRLLSNSWPSSLFFLLLCRPRQPNWVQLMGWSAWQVIHLVRSAITFLLFLDSFYNQSNPVKSALHSQKPLLRHDRSWSKRDH